MKLISEIHKMILMTEHKHIDAQVLRYRTYKAQLPSTEYIGWMDFVFHENTHTLPPPDKWITPGIGYLMLDYLKLVGKLQNNKND
jgi:hypothetical protein